MTKDSSAPEEHQPLSESALLPFVVSLLPLLLSPSFVHLPSQLLSRPVALRHTFLRPAADSPSYLQASNNSAIQERVAERLQRLAACWLEDVHVDTEGVGYSASLADDEGVRARVRVGDGETEPSAAGGSDDSSALDVLVVWEGEQAAAGPVPGASDGRGEQDTLEAGWRYYDLQLPSETGKERWFPTLEAALVAAQAPPKVTTSAIDSQNKAKSKRKKGRPARPPYPAVQEEGLQGEESGAPNPDDYWAGCSSSEEDGSAGEDQSASGGEEREDDYWGSYGNEEGQCAADGPQPATDNPPAKAIPAIPSAGDTVLAVEAQSSPPKPTQQPPEVSKTSQEAQSSAIHYPSALFDANKRNISFLGQGEDDGGASTPGWGGVESRGSLHDGHRNMSFMAEQGNLQPWVASSNGFASASGQHSPLALALEPTTADVSVDLNSRPGDDDADDQGEDEAEGEYIASRRYGYRNYYADAPESLYSPPTALALSFSAGADKRVAERKADNGNLLKTAVAALRQAAAAEQEEEEQARRSRSMSQSRAMEQMRGTGGSGRDEAVKQALRGVWELYRLAGSALPEDVSGSGEARSGRRKDPRIERYEFLELVRAVVEGDEE